MSDNNEEELKYISPFKFQLLQSFPYIAEDFDQYTEYQLFCKLVEKINEVVGNENVVTREVNEMKAYFDTLDLQDEVNNKLDEMATSGVLQNMINNIFNELEYEITTNYNTLNTKINNNTNNLQNQINSVASGSPAGSYATVEALTAADPAHNKIYVVLSDGHWYYWDSTNKVWASGGVYQSISNDVVDKLEREVGTLVEFIDVSLSSTNNNVYAMNLHSGDYLKITSTGNINVWTHSSSNKADTYDVENLGFVSNGTSPKYVTLTENASYVRIYASTNSNVSIAVMNKRVPTLETKVATIESSLTEYNEEIEENADAIDRIENDVFIKKENLIEEINEGEYYIAWNIGDTASTSANESYACGRAKVKNLDYITLNIPISETFSFYADANGKKIAAITGTQQGANLVYSVPSNAYYIYISTAYNQYWGIYGLVLMRGQENINNPMASADTYPYATPIYYGDNIKLENGFELGDLSNLSKTYRVEKDGSGDFDKLVDAIKEATKYQNTTVVLGAGEWDIISEMGSDMALISDSNRGLYLKNGIHLVCSPRSKIVANYTGSESNIIQYFSVFNSGPGGFTLEGATIESSNIRYAIHDERGSDADLYTNKYINCNIKHINGYYEQCIGGGLGLNGHIIIDGCIFDGDSDANYLVSYHNSGDGHWESTDSQNAKSFIDIKGNYISNSSSIQIINFGKSNKLTPVLIHDNSLGADISTINGSAYYYTNFDVKSYNNTIR